jgi:APA family basic amino acid/polyamine antiporter
MGTGPALARRLGTRDAVVVGLGSMVGAGVFAAFGPAAAAAGAGLLVGLALAAVVATCNATASAQLAAQHPSSGGTYLYGREQLGPWWDFVAGWGFVVGKTASCAAMALAFAAYAVPPALQRPTAVAAVLALAAVNLRGITRTARLARLLLAVVLLCLGAAVVTALAGGDVDPGRLASWADPPGGWYGVLQSAGLLFFAVAGYARIATLGEEVRDPERTIPRAVLLTLAGAVALYAAVAVTLLLVLGPQDLAAAAAPLSVAVERATGAGSAAGALLGAVVVAGAAAASLGALLALIAGVGRTSLAMARSGDLPAWLAAVHPRSRVPHHAEVALALAVCALVLVVDLRGAIGFSSFGVLTYYAVTNLAAARQPAHRRWSPRGRQVLGGTGCLVLVATLPVSSVVAGAAVLTAGVGYRAGRLRRAARRP